MARKCCVTATTTPRAGHQAAPPSGVCGALMATSLARATGLAPRRARLRRARFVARTRSRQSGARAVCTW
eukprot:scaffold29226_cov110-Isochrysis_galbana.AAC.7